MTPIRSHVAKPLRIIWVSPGLLVAELVSGIVVAGVSGGQFLFPIVFWSISHPIAIAYSIREPHADIVLTEILRRIIPIKLPGYPHAKTKNTFAIKGTYYVP